VRNVNRDIRPGAMVAVEYLFHGRLGAHPEEILVGVDLWPV